MAKNVNTDAGKKPVKGRGHAARPAGAAAKAKPSTKTAHGKAEKGAPKKAEKAAPAGSRKAAAAREVPKGKAAHAGSVEKPAKAPGAVRAAPGKKAAKAAPVKEAAIDTDNDSAVAVDAGLRLIQSNPEGILQSELWKELGVDSRKCSRIVKRLEDSGLIERLEFKREGIKTYLLRAKQQPVNPAELLAGDELIPCIGCELECVVEECHPLMDWMYQLAIVEHTEE